MLTLLLGLSACRSEHVVATQLTETATLSLTVRPIFSLQSDWHRSVTVRNGSKRITRTLGEDTGWWRGSHLYVHRSGTHVLHEGQGGCHPFSLTPLGFGTMVEISCEKALPSDGVATSSATHLDGYPASRYFKEFYYIGRFIEADQVPDLHAKPGAAPVIFQSHRAQPEPELPDIL